MTTEKQASKIKRNFFRVLEGTLSDIEVDGNLVPKVRIDWVDKNFVGIEYGNGEQEVISLERITNIFGTYNEDTANHSS